MEVPYTTVFEYMLQFHWACASVRSLGSQAMIYSAAAVSDFYIPYSQMGEHKIQSAEGDPHIPLTNTPKMLYLVHTSGLRRRTSCLSSWRQTHRSC